MKMVVVAKKHGFYDILFAHGWQDHRKIPKTILTCYYRRHSVYNNVRFSVGHDDDIQLYHQMKRIPEIYR